MPKYWGKQIFTRGRFPKVGQKQKIGERKKERLNDGNNNGQLRIANATTGGAREAACAKIGAISGLYGELDRVNVYKKGIGLGHSSSSQGGCNQTHYAVQTVQFLKYNFSN